MAETAALLVDEVLPERPLRQWVLSLPYALRFLLRRAGLTRATGDTGAVTLVQRFGSALNLNIHFHMLVLAGVYLPVAGGPPVFRHLPAPTGAQLQALARQIAARVGRLLERRGLIERDMENAWLAGDGEAGPLDDLIGPSITCRIAVGPRAGPGGVDSEVRARGNDRLRAVRRGLPTAGLAKRGLVAGVGRIERRDGAQVH